MQRQESVRIKKKNALKKKGYPPPGPPQFGRIISFLILLHQIIFSRLTRDKSRIFFLLIVLGVPFLVLPMILSHACARGFSLFVFPSEEQVVHTPRQLKFFWDP